MSSCTVAATNAAAARRFTSRASIGRAGLRATPYWRRVVLVMLGAFRSSWSVRGCDPGSDHRSSAARKRASLDWSSREIAEVAADVPVADGAPPGRGRGDHARLAVLAAVGLVTGRAGVSEL